MEGMAEMAEMDGKVVRVVTSARVGTSAARVVTSAEATRAVKNPPTVAGLVVAGLVVAGLAELMALVPAGGVGRSSLGMHQAHCNPSQ